jgi:hypothetical protein
LRTWDLNGPPKNKGEFLKIYCRMKILNVWRYWMKKVGDFG